MSNQYQYRPLTTKSTVRLIRLESSKVEDRIACKICYTEQSTAEYDALSYLWGDPTPTREILIFNEDDQGWTSFYVHENLWQFLDNARERKMFDRWIWTDRICLNQNDEEEKKEQIPRMAGIYHEAVRVIAWLGLSVSQGRDLSRVHDIIKVARRRMNSCGYSKDEALAAFALCSAKYWERVWVLQELVSAKDIVCFIGNMDMTFQEVGMIPPCWLTHPDHAIRDDTSGNMDALEFHRVVRGLSASASSGGSGCVPKRHLWHLLSFSTHNSFNSQRPECQRLKSQRPHDRVYGLLGLAKDFSDGTSPLSHIEVDYSKPPADAFLDVILESRPDCGRGSLRNYELVIGLLLERPENTAIWEPVFTFLSRYTESDRTSPRHRELAKLVLSVSDAFYLLVSISGSLPGYWPRLVRRAFGSLLHEMNFNIYFERTVQFDAAMLGLALVACLAHNELWMQSFKDWKACRHFKAMASSPWRCAAHSLPSEPPVTQEIECHQAKKRKQDARREREVHRSTELEWTLGLERPFEKVCDGFEDLQSSGPCEGSLLCEFPGANLRLQFSIHEDSVGFWRTKQIHLVATIP